MPFALVTIGLIMIVTGAKDTYDAFGSQVVGDFTGPGNFTYWIASLGAVGAVGYVPEFRGFSRAFMALIIIAMVIRNGGFFDKFKSALSSGPTKPAQNATPTPTNAGGVAGMVSPTSPSSPAPGLIGGVLNPVTTIERGANTVVNSANTLLQSIRNWAGI